MTVKLPGMLNSVHKEPFRRCYLTLFLQVNQYIDDR